MWRLNFILFFRQYWTYGDSPESRCIIFGCYLTLETFLESRLVNFGIEIHSIPQVPGTECSDCPCLDNAYNATFSQHGGVVTADDACRLGPNWLDDD